MASGLLARRGCRFLKLGSLAVKFSRPGCDIPGTDGGRVDTKDEGGKEDGGEKEKLHDGF